MILACAGVTFVAALAATVVAAARGGAGWWLTVSVLALVYLLLTTLNARMPVVTGPRPAPPPHLFLGLLGLLTVLALAVSLVLGPFVSGAWGFAVFFGILFFAEAWWGSRVPLSPRTTQELAYVGRTAERAAIFWAVGRTLNGMFGRR